MFELHTFTETNPYFVFKGDCIEHMATLPDACMDMSIFSPPFPSVYAYGSSDADIGNSENFRGDARLHLSFFFQQLSRIIKPGRVVICHVQQIPRMKRCGEVGLHDFRGLLIKLAERSGLVFEYDWLVTKNPQAQAIRTRSRELQFAGLESDRAKTRGTLCDYLLKFRAPGVNAIPIDAESQVSRNDWIRWAEGAWTDIIETDTLNTEEAKHEDDVKHICPLQLEVIRRCILLFTNPGEIVFSPFAGVGSEGFMALGGKSPKTGNRIADPRKFYGCELKDTYFATCARNLARAMKMASSQDQKLLFAGVAP